MSAPIDAFGCARTSMFGSVLVVAGSVLSSVAPSLWMLFVTQGVITGEPF